MGVVLRKRAHTLEYGFVIDPSSQRFHFRRRLHAVLKVPIGLREYFCAHVSQRNGSPFCGFNILEYEL